VLEVDNFYVWLGERTTYGVFFINIMWALSLSRYVDCVIVFKTVQGIDACFLVSQGVVPLTGHSMR